jgi:SAM-dependent methyltransferase
VAIHDHFSGVAEEYARFRPEYPPALFDWLAQAVPRRELAWDCACGSGQATVSLADRFVLVAGTDVSLKQLANTPAIDNTVFSAATAESSPLADHSVDLVTVGQALHWFDLEAFFNEVRRVLVPGGVVAAWTYGLPQVDDDEIGAVVSHFITDTMWPYWPPETAHVIDGYATIALPFPALEPPPFEMAVGWTLPRFLGFTRTWSGVARWVEMHGNDPVDGLAVELGRLWGDDGALRTIRWSLKIRAGRV